MNYLKINRKFFSLSLRPRAKRGKQSHFESIQKIASLTLAMTWLVFFISSLNAQPLNLSALQKIEMQIANSPSLQKDKLSETQKKIDTSVLIFKEKLSPKNLRVLGIESAPQNLSNDFQKVNAQGQIQLYVKYTDESFADQLSQDILSVGGKIDLLSKEMGLIQCWVPSDKIEVIASKQHVRRVTLPGYAIRRPINLENEIIKNKPIQENSIKKLQQGSVDSSADTVSQADKVRLAGITGKGIKVGVISDGIKSIALSQASGDIPATYEAKSAMAVEDLNAGAEGLAMMEIVHDIAPDASLAFSNPGTSAEMIKAIQILDSTFNCDVIVDDLAFLTEPFFEDGILEKQVTVGVNRGKLYLASAGNMGNKMYYEGDFSGLIENGLMLQDFDGKGDVLLPVYIPKNGIAQIILQWNDKWGESGSDYDLFAFDDTVSTVIGASINTQDGNDYPIEGMLINNTTGVPNTYYISIVKKSGANKRLKIETYLPRGYGFQKYSTSAGSIFHHAKGKDVFTIGAISLSTPEVIESFSSQGPVRIDFPYLEYRQKPDICGIDGVPVTGNGGFTTPFYGTSASAPHVAGLAALLWSANKSLSANAIKSLLKGTTVDLGTAESDTIFGFGRANVFNAYTALSNNKTLSTTIEAGIPNVMIYPNPAKLSGFTNSIIFDNLKGDETVRIFTIAGELVTSFTAATGNTSWVWDLRNSSGNLTASGIYVYLITNAAGQKRIGKLAVMN